TGEAILGIAQSGRSDETGGHHSEAAHDGDGNCSAARKAIRGDSEHGGPEEGLAKGVNCKCSQSAAKRINAAHKIKPEAGERRTNHQNANWREANSFLDEIGAEAESKHQR